MVTMHNFDNVLEYVNRLGFAGHGRMMDRSNNIASVAADICTHAGIPAKWDNGVTFSVHFNRSDDPDYNSPWYGSFTVINVSGDRLILRFNRQTHKLFVFTTIYK